MTQERQVERITAKKIRFKKYGGGSQGTLGGTTDKEWNKACRQELAIRTGLEKKEHVQIKVKREACGC